MNFLIVFLFVFYSTLSMAQMTFSSITNGNYNNASVWDVAVAPPFIIPNGRTVNINNDVVITGNIRVDGTLVVNSGARLIGNVQIRIDVNGRLENHGEIDISEEFRNNGEVFNSGLLKTEEVVDRGYTCNSGTIEVEAGEEYECVGCEIECGGSIIACNVEVEENGSTQANISNTDFCCSDGSDPVWDIEDSPIIDSSTVTNCGVQLNIALFLPIELGDYYLQQKDRAVVCHWTTLSETNNKYFTIWKSTNGLDFDAIGEVKGAGESSQELHYEFIDLAPSFGLSYYRLSQTDFDGKSEYFKPKSIEFSNSSNSLIYYDRQNASMNVSLDYPSSIVDIEVYDLNGRLLWQFSHRDISKSKHHIFEVASLPIGLYMVKLSTDRESMIKKTWVSHSN